MAKNLKLSWVKKNKKVAIFLVVLLLFAAFLRLYKIREFLIFLGDEGRDALVVKRILVDHKLTLLGPTASVGGFYLGPIYYYFMAPFLWLFRFDPVGPAVMVALFGIANVALIFKAMKDWVSQKAAVVSALLFATAPGIVMTSRSSWNPNIMPFFSLLSVYSMYLAVKKNNLFWYAISGMALGIALQSHYLGLILIPVLGVSLLITTQLKYWLRAITSTVIGFLLGFSMFLAFELRHNFPNSRSVIEFISRGGNTTGPRSFDLIWLLFEMMRRTFDAVLLTYPELFVRSLVLVCLVSLAVFFKKQLNQKTVKIGSKLILIWVILGSLGIGFYRGQLHPHYFGFLFPVPFILIGVGYSVFHKYSWGKILSTLVICGMIVMNIYTLPIWGKGSSLINQTEEVADKVIILTKNEPYNFALISSGNSDHAYRYFLEIKNEKPVPLEERVAEQLIVVCEDLDNPCLPLGHPIWEIAGFGRAEIVEQSTVFPGIKVVKLVHHQDSIDLIGKPAPKGS